MSIRILPSPLRAPAMPQGLCAPLAHAPASFINPPRLTVVTPSYNQGQYLETTLRSVLDQGYPNLEYIVVDGGSKDESRAILEHYSSALDYWVSEPDQGQSHAIEKGLVRATGEWFIWINSDDILAPGCLWKVAAAAQGNPVDMIAGSTCHFDESGAGPTYQPQNITLRNIVLELLESGIRWQQPSTWLRTEPLKALGLNRQLHYAFDYELFLRYLTRHDRVRYLSDTLAYFRLHDASKTVSQAAKFQQEQLSIYRNLLQDPAYRDTHALLDQAYRGVSWFHRQDKLLREAERPRLSRIRELINEIGQDRDMRCNKHSRKTLRRLAIYGGYRGA